MYQDNMGKLQLNLVFLTMRFLISIFLLFFFQASLVEAQSEAGAISARYRDFLKLLYFHKSEIEARFDYIGEQGDSEGSAEFDSRQLDLNLSFPFPLKDDWFIALGGDIGRQDLSFSNSSSFKSDTELYDLFGQVDLGHFLNNHLFFQGSAGVGIFSDFEADFADSLQFKGQAQLVWRLNPGAQLLAGLRYSQDFEDTPLFPLIGIRLQDTEGRLHLSLTFPLEAQVSFHLDGERELFLKASLKGNEYELEPNRVASLPDTVEVYQREQRLSIGYRQWFGHHFALAFEAGGTPGSMFELQANGTRDFTDGDLDTTWFASLILDVRL